MASIKKRPNGTYQATIYAGRDANGKMIRKYITKPSWKECRDAAREVEQELAEGKFLNIENTRLVVWIEQYLEINKNNYAPSTRVLYKQYLKSHYQPFFGQLKLKQLNEIHLKKFKNYLLERMLPSSARRVMSTLNKILKEALKDKSPTKDVELPKANKSRAKAPTTEEFMLIHAEVKDTKYEPFVLLAGWCGFRRGEIFGLKPDDIDFKKGTIRIDESYSINDDGKFVLGPPKSENGYRTEVAPKYLMDLLKEYVPKESKVTDINKRKSNKRIFRGRPDNFSSDYAKMVFEKKLPKYRFHDLRHYHATWLFDNGVPDKYAAKRMGQTLDVLKNIYQHLGVDKQKEIENKILSIDTNMTAK